MHARRCIRSLSLHARMRPFCRISHAPHRMFCICDWGHKTAFPPPMSAFTYAGQWNGKDRSALPSFGVILSRKEPYNVRTGRLRRIQKYEVRHRPSGFFTFVQNDGIIRATFPRRSAFLPPPWGGAVQFSLSRAVHGERHRDRSGGNRDGPCGGPCRPRLPRPLPGEGGRGVGCPVILSVAPRARLLLYTKRGTPRPKLLL